MIIETVSYFRKKIDDITDGQVAKSARVALTAHDKIKSTIVEPKFERKKSKNGKLKTECEMESESLN